MEGITRGKGGWVFRKTYKGHMDKPKGDRIESGRWGRKGTTVLVQQ